MLPFADSRSQVNPHRSRGELLNGFAGPYHSAPRIGPSASRLLIRNHCMCVSLAFASVLEAHFCIPVPFGAILRSLASALLKIALDDKGDNAQEMAKSLLCSLISYHSGQKNLGDNPNEVQHGHGYGDVCRAILTEVGGAFHSLGDEDRIIILELVQSGASIRFLGLTPS